MALGPVMMGISGTRLAADERELLRHPAVGGVILFDRNYADPDQLRELAREIHVLRNPQLLIAVDQEGGRVQRFRAGFTALPAAGTFGERYDSDHDAARALAEDFGWVMAVELRACGIDFSFAPVLDLGTGQSRVIGDRALHARPEAVVSLARAMVRGMSAAGMSAVGKHFPGHGSVAEDSHVEMPVDRRDLQSIRAADLVPFARMIRDALPAVMAAHVCYPAVDDQPAGYSRVWLERVLRGELGFGGAIFSDDLGMSAACGAGDMAARTRCSLAAGCDMVLICNDRPGAEAALEALGEERSALRAARLARMHGRGDVTRSALEADPRYRERAGRVTALQIAPELDLGDDTPM